MAYLCYPLMNYRQNVVRFDGHVLQVDKLEHALARLEALSTRLEGLKLRAANVE